jgi:hypothetical protein
MELTAPLLIDALPRDVYEFENDSFADWVRDIVD